MHAARSFLLTHANHLPQDTISSLVPRQDKVTAPHILASGMIQVPAERLNTLLTSVESLKKEIALVQSLKKELALVQTQNQELRGDLPANRNPKINLESRTELLTCYCVEEKGPLVTASGLIASAQSNPSNLIRQVCHESRVEAETVQTIRFYRHWADEHSSTDPYVFSNPFADILWLHESETHDGHDDAWLGGGYLLPPRHRSHTLLFQGPNALLAREFEPRVIALPYQQFFEQTDSGLPWMMDFFTQKKTEKIVLVIDSDYSECVAKSGEPVFVLPEKRPSKTLYENFFIWRQAFGAQHHQELEWETGDNSGEYCGRVIRVSQNSLFVLGSFGDGADKEVFKEGGKYSNILHPSEWIVNEIYFMEDMTVQQLQKSNGLSPSVHRKLRSEAIPPQ
ncbi:uncharacterized protein PAC_16598 [Phialocephala subalpina]|uniref:Uncharacterized protein n=1 Tax=Phialocephala subalpina TaxID=576137 RepID=A0A1L7XP05_9HELO|nr:uncharacterized protein PAC_16598 [Phialocephala subalpina]